jgi:hypothetical protein
MDNVQEAVLIPHIRFEICVPNRDQRLRAGWSKSKNDILFRPLVRHIIAGKARIVHMTFHGRADSVRLVFSQATLPYIKCTEHTVKCTVDTQKATVVLPVHETACIYL